MNKWILIVVIPLLLAAHFLMAGCKPIAPSLWELKCAACHDGKTVLNDQVVPDRQDLIDKYSNIEQFMLSCMGAPECMNILKHDEELFREVGREIGIPEE